MNGSMDFEGVHGSMNTLDLEWARLLAILPRFHTNDGVLRRKMMSQFVFIGPPNSMGTKTQLAPVLFHAGFPSVQPSVLPRKGVPDTSTRSEARQLKTNPFPSPTKTIITSNKPRDGRVGEKFVLFQCCKGVPRPLTLTRTSIQSWRSFSKDRE